MSVREEIDLYLAVIRTYGVTIDVKCNDIHTDAILDIEALITVSDFQIAPDGYIVCDTIEDALEECSLILDGLEFPQPSVWTPKSP